MNYQIRAFQISLLIHGVILAVVLFYDPNVGRQYPQVIFLDFSLPEPVSGITEAGPQAGKSLVKTKSVNTPSRQSVKKEESLRPPAETSQTSTVPEPQPVAKFTEHHNLENSSPGGLQTSDLVRAAKAGSDGIVNVVKEGEGRGAVMGRRSGGNRAAQAQYLNDHFAYIRDKILRNINYPDAARRMGWQGRVLLSFIIMSNGSVRAFQVIQTSGFALLDECAIETVKDTAPFPRPPGEAQLVIPITYRLE